MAALEILLLAAVLAFLTVILIKMNNDAKAKRDARLERMFSVKPTTEGKEDGTESR
jgi:hypothetical protein